MKTIVIILLLAAMVSAHPHDPKFSAQNDIPSKLEESPEGAPGDNLNDHDHGSESDPQHGNFDSPNVPVPGNDDGQLDAQGTMADRPKRWFLNKHFHWHGNGRSYHDHSHVKYCRHWHRHCTHYSHPYHHDHCENVCDSWGWYY